MCLTIYDTVMGAVLNILTYVYVLVSGSEVFWLLLFCFFFVFLVYGLQVLGRSLYLSSLVLKYFLIYNFIAVFL